MIKRPFLIAVAGLLVVVGALLLLFLSDEEVPENNTDASTTVNSNVNQNPLKEINLKVQKASYGEDGKMKKQKIQKQ